MNKLLQHLIDSGDVSHKVLPSLMKFQMKGEVPAGLKPIPRSGGDIASLPQVQKQIILSKDQLAKNKAAVAQRVASENAKILAERKARLAGAEKAKSQPFSAKQLAEETQATGDKLRLFPNDPNSFIDDYLNPGVFIGNMASGLGKVPLNVQEGNYTDAALAIGTPLAFGAAEALAAPYIKKGADFIKNNVYKINPNKEVLQSKVYQTFGPNNSNSGLLNFLKAPAAINPVGIAADHGFGILKGGIKQAKGLLGELGVLKNQPARRPFFETFPITKAQRAKVMAMQDEALVDAQNFTNDYWYGNSLDVRPVLEEKMRNILPQFKMAKYDNNLERGNSPFGKVPDQLVRNTTWGEGREGLSQDMINYLNDNRGSIGGVNTDEASITLRNSGLYYKTPREIANTVAHESGHSAQNFAVMGEFDTSPYTISDYSKKTWGEQLAKADPKYNYYTSNPDTEIGRRFQAALVSPKKSLFPNGLTKETWRSSPNEVHSELMASKYNMYKQGLRQGYTPEQMMERVTNPGQKELEWLLDNKTINKHFKKGTSREERLALLKLLPAAVPAVAGAATLQQQKEGGELMRMQWAGQVSSKDSVRNMAGKIVKYEQLRGGPGGTPLPQYADPKYMDMLMNNIYPEVRKIMPKASAMETGEAMDFVFNAGWDTTTNKIQKDPRAYVLQEYYKKNDPSKVDADGKWSGRKNPAYSFDNEYNATIGKLSENERRVLMNKGRDWYYKNINNPAPGVPNSNYKDTWFGRIWNTNDYAPFNASDPRFVPKKEKGGEKTEYKGPSIVDYLATKGYSGKKSFRKDLASKYGVEDYDYSARKNTELLNRMRENDDLLETFKQNAAPVSAESLEQMYRANLEAKKQENYNNIRRRMALDMGYDPLAGQGQFEQAQYPELSLIPKNPNGKNSLVNGLQGSGRQQQPAPAPATQRPANFQYVQPGKPSAQTNFQQFPGYPEQPTPDQKPVSLVSGPGNFQQFQPYPNRQVDGNRQVSLASGPGNFQQFPAYPKQTSPAQSISLVSGPGNFQQFPGYSQEVASTPRPVSLISGPGNFQQFPAYPTRQVADLPKKTTAKTAAKALKKDIDEESWFEETASAVADGINTAYNLGTNYAKRQYFKMFGDDDNQVSVLNQPVINTPKKLPGNKPGQVATPPQELPPAIIKGNNLWDEGNRVFHAPEIIDLTRTKWGHRNRGDRAEVNSAGYEFGVIDDPKNPNRIKSTKSINLDDAATYVGIDKEGKMKVGTGKMFRDKEYFVGRFNSLNDVTGFKRKASGDYDLIDASDAAADHVSPQMVNENGETRSAGLLIKKNSPNNYNLYGNITGGHIIVTSPDYKKQILISGSLTDVDTAMNKFMKDNKLSKVNFVQLDNGSFSRNFKTTDNKITANDWKNFDDRNKSGGSGFFLQGSGMKNGGPIVDPRGQWAHPGKVTRIPSSQITMQGVSYPVYGVGNNGQSKMMYPGQDYDFGGASYVDEYPMMQKGGSLPAYQIKGQVAPSYTDNTRVASRVPIITKKDELHNARMADEKNAKNFLNQYYNWATDNAPFYSNLTSNDSSTAELAYNNNYKTDYNRLRKYIDDNINSDKDINNEFDSLFYYQGYPQYIDNPAIKAGAQKNIAPYYQAQKKLPLKNLNAPDTLVFHKGYVRNEQGLKGQYNPKTNITDVSDRTRVGTLVHERAHKADRSKRVKGITEEDLGDFVRRENPDLGESSSFLDNEDLDYLRDFSERQARHRSTQFWLQNNMPGYNFKQPLSQKEYDFLIQNKQKIPGDVRQLLTLYGDRDNFVKYINRFQNGGGLLSRSVSCSSCGHSWKSVDGGGDPLHCHKCGGMVKMKAGGEMIRRADGSYSQRGLWDNVRANKGSGKKPTKQMLEQERKIKKAQWGLEFKVDDWLGKPMEKAEMMADKFTKPGNDQTDNFRHPMAGRYASEAIQRKTGNIPVLSNILGFIGSSAAGLGHELLDPNRGPDKRPYTLGQTIREGAEDQFNNMVGALIGSLPFMSATKKTQTLKYLSDNNLIPDGYGRNSDNMYFKKMGGKVPKPFNGKQPLEKKHNIKVNYK